MTGFGTAFRLAFRRNWLFYLLWVLILCTFMPMTVKQYASIVPPGAEGDLMLQALAAQPTMRAILGPPFDLTTAGGFAFWRVGAFTATAAAMMAALGVIRSTRAEEEEGRVELLRSGAIGARAPLAAGVALAVLASVLLGAIITAAMIGVDTPAAGAVASGAAIALTGSMFAGLAALVGQFFESARTVRAWCVGLLLGGLYLVRALVDGSQRPGESNALLDTLQWLNPLTWAALVRPYAVERWWVLLLPAALGAIALTVAFALESRRDLGAGLVATRPGPAHASPSLAGAWGLAWRLQRGGVIGWTIGLVVSGVAIGSLAQAASNFIRSDNQFGKILEKLSGGADNADDAFFATLVAIIVVVLALAAVSFLGRLRSEETTGHAELMLSTATPRVRLAASHLVIALATTAVLTVVTATLMAVVPVAGGAPTSRFADLAAGGLVLVPGLVLVVGVAMALTGWAPGLYLLAWILVAWSMFAAWIGALFDLPEWLLKLHPWGHLTHLPGNTLDWTPLWITTAIGLALIALGLAGYRRRDIQGR